VEEEPGVCKFLTAFIGVYRIPVHHGLLWRSRLGVVVEEPRGRDVL